MTCEYCHHDPSSNVERPARGVERRLIDDLLQGIDCPSAIITDIAVGAHFIGVRADDNGSDRTGLASSLGAVPTAGERQMVAEMIGKPIHTVAEWLKEPGAFSITLGTAALNAGINAPRNQPDIEASRIMAAKGKDEVTVLVGEFPFTDWLRRQVKTLYLLELKEVPGRTPPEQWDDILAQCGVLGLTGTTLVTRAMATYLEKAPYAFTIIIGPTTPLSPVLFSYGADVLAGCEVVTPEAVFAGIRDGLSFRELKPLGIEFIAWSQDAASP